MEAEAAQQPSRLSYFFMPSSLVPLLASTADILIVCSRAFSTKRRRPAIPPCFGSGRCVQGCNASSKASKGRKKGHGMSKGHCRLYGHAEAVVKKGRVFHANFLCVLYAQSWP